MRNNSGDALGVQVGGGAVTRPEGGEQDKSFILAFLSSVVSFSPHDLPYEGGTVVAGTIFFFNHFID